MRKLLLIVVGLLVVAAGVVTWDELYRDEAQPAWIAGTPRSQFLYGSVGAEKEAGIPYWIWLALPRLFPEYLPGPGGYAALGLSWQETFEMPAGLAKKTIGYVRVGGNCALCHAFSKANPDRQAPTVFAAAMGHTGEVQRLLTFYKQCAEDPRFNADNLFSEIYADTKLSLLERLLYRYVLIPKTRERMLKGDSLLVDEASWQHSKDPHANSAQMKQTLQTLETSLKDEEKAQLDGYLKTLQ